jgi:hypothetical protein
LEQHVGALEQHVGSGGVFFSIDSVRKEAAAFYFLFGRWWSYFYGLVCLDSRIHPKFHYKKEDSPSH